MCRAGSPNTTTSLKHTKKGRAGWLALAKSLRSQVRYPTCVGSRLSIWPDVGIPPPVDPELKAITPIATKFRNGISTRSSRCASRKVRTRATVLVILICSIPNAYEETNPLPWSCTRVEACGRCQRRSTPWTVIRPVRTEIGYPQQCRTDPAFH